ncbi:MAG: hypothetical protein KAT07_06875 [Calditrichia bacterium]|nr:hypothetical protein [Calditrichia bacterium]
MAFGADFEPDTGNSCSIRITKEESGSGNGTFDFLGFTHYWGKSRQGILGY